MALLTEEHNMLRDSAWNWAQANAPVSALRKMRDSGNALGYDAERFAQIADMGWAGIIIPEAYGGSNFGVLAMGLVLEALGRNLVAVPLIASAVGAASVLVLGGSETQQKTWLPRIAEGKAIATLAINEGSHYAPERMVFSATRSTSGGYRLSGTKTFVMEGMAADVFVVGARSSKAVGDEKAVSLFLVEAGSPGLRRKRRSLIDSRGYADVTFDDVEVDAEAVIGEPDAGMGILDRALDRATAAVAAEQMGLGQQAFELTVEYMKTRVQFGQTIGSFQALQHRAALLFGAMQLARPAVGEALQAIDEERPTVPELVSLAKVAASDFVNYVTREMLQLHGGIGMTDAHDSGFYLKRARVLEAAFGSSGYHRERYARILGI